VEAVRRRGHDAVVVARSRGVDVSTGEGLDQALAGVNAVIDVTSMQGSDAETTRNLFGAATRISYWPSGAKVGHHVLLSIAGIDRLDGNAHFAGKRMQEQLLSESPIPVTIKRATQFHEFAEMVVGWTRQGEEAMVPPILVQPVAAADVADVLAEIVTGGPQGRATDFAGPNRKT
jgi:uncharacterized protein YbjT (DUF2867 family)